MLNARIRKRWLKGDCLIGVVGEKADLTYGYNYLGAGPEALAAFADHPPANKTKPMFILGAGAFARTDGAAVLSLAAKAALSLGVVKDGWNGFNVLHGAASRVGGLDLGLVPGEGGLDARGDGEGRRGRSCCSTSAPTRSTSSRGAFVVYIGTHGDRGAHRADVILPGAAYTEKTGIYVNTEGRPQFAERAVFPPGDAREDWAILRALSDALGARLPYDSLAALRAALAAAHPDLVRYDVVAPADAGVFAALAARGGALERAPFASRRSPTSISPTRSPALPASWPNARPCAPAVRLGRRRNRTKMTSATPSHPVQTNLDRASSSPSPASSSSPRF